MNEIYISYFFNPRREVLNEQLAQVVEGLEFAGLRSRQIRGQRSEVRRAARKTRVCDSTHDSLLQTLQVLFGLLVALVQESEHQLFIFEKKERNMSEWVASGALCWTVAEGRFSI